MDFSDIKNILWLASAVGQLLLLAIFIARRLYRGFPVFAIFLSWEIVSDFLFFLALSSSGSYFGAHSIQLYYWLSVVTYLLELSVLLEIAINVLRPAKRSLPKGISKFAWGAMSLIGAACFFLAVWINPTPFTRMRMFLVMDTTAAILCLLVFLLIAGFSQLLGLNWKNHVLQLTTGLAFYSTVELLVELIQSQLHPGASYAAQYQMWSQIEAIGYLCTLSFWCYAFLKKEAPRKEFSPQMAQVLVYLSGGAKRQHAVLARSRDD